jgi:hypothetical protein
MASGGVRLQICGTIAVEIAGTRREHDLPGQQVGTYWPSSS